MNLSGYALYIACSRRLITIGITAPLTAAPTPSPIPALAGFTAVPVYDNPDRPATLTDFALTTFFPLPNNFTPVLRASAAVSTARGNIRASDLRVIEAGVMWATQPHSALAPWLAIYQAFPAAGAVTFALSLVDPVSGLVGAEVRASTAYAIHGETPTGSRTVTIEVEGVTIAEIPDTYIQVEGITVAN